VWLTHVILATQEEEIRRITVQSQLWPKKSLQGPILKTLHKKRAGRVAQGEGPKFKLQYLQKKKKDNYNLY
jgi:hypothetical protein